MSVTGHDDGADYIQGVLPLEITSPARRRTETTTTPPTFGAVRPSQITDEFWVLVRAPASVMLARPPHPDRTGKWMVFQRPGAHDALWELVRDETEAGRLGIWAKAATGKSNPHSLGRKLPIMVYTYDHEDQDDVMRVREILRELGVSWLVSYKPDRATRDGEYSARGDKVSMYRA